jgi:hypothetical protein
MRPSTYAHALLNGLCLQNQSTINIYANSKETNSLYSTNIETQLSHIIYTGQTCFLTSAAIMGVQMGQMSKLG